jgi:hypothetical protein
MSHPSLPSIEERVSIKEGENVINKKNLLGKQPAELGLKDAIHTAIVSVRAGGPIKPGQRCGMNKDREAVANSKGPGVADPFLKETITRGQAFWLLLNQDEIPNVQHVWEHPSVDFTPPTKECEGNRAIAQCAKYYGVTYAQIMAAAEYVVENEEPAKYPGTLTETELADVEFDQYEFWSEWAEETCHEFPNEGSACCPEYCYPDCSLFEVSA